MNNMIFVLFSLSLYIFTKLVFRSFSFKKIEGDFPPSFLNYFLQRRLILHLQSYKHNYIVPNVYDDPFYIIMFYRLQLHIFTFVFGGCYSHHITGVWPLEQKVGWTHLNTHIRASTQLEKHHASRDVSSSDSLDKHWPST